MFFERDENICPFRWDACYWRSTDFILGDSLRGLWGKFNHYMDTILSFLDHLNIGFLGLVRCSMWSVLRPWNLIGVHWGPIRSIRVHWECVGANYWGPIHWECIGANYFLGFRGCLVAVHWMFVTCWLGFCWGFSVRKVVIEEWLTVSSS